MNYSDQYHTLNNINYDIGIVPNCNQMIPAKVVDVYDGDTITVIFLLNGNKDSPFKIKIRILGIDTPEIRTKNPEEKRAAIVVRDYVKNMLLNQIITLEIKKWDKYGGRLDGNIYVNNPYGNNFSLADHLININYAKNYDGSGKKEWTNNELRKIKCKN